MKIFLTSDIWYKAVSMLAHKCCTAEAYQQLYACSILEILIPHLFPQSFPLMPVNELLNSVCCDPFFGCFYHQIPGRHPRSHTDVRLDICRHISPHATDLWKLQAAERQLTLAQKPSPPPPLTSSLPTSPVNVGMWHSTRLCIHYL